MAEDFCRLAWQHSSQDLARTQVGSPAGAAAMFALQRSCYAAGARVQPGLNALRLTHSLSEPDHPKDGRRWQIFCFVHHHMQRPCMPQVMVVAKAKAQGRGVAGGQVNSGAAANRASTRRHLPEPAQHVQQLHVNGYDVPTARLQNAFRCTVCRRWCVAKVDVWSAPCGMH